MRTGKQLALGIGVVGAVAAGVSLAFIVPNYREARAVRAQVEDLQARVNTLGARSSAVDRLEQEVRNARDIAASNLKTIPDNADVAGLIRKLSDHIDGVNIVDQTFTAGTPGPAIIGGESGAASSGASTAKAPVSPAPPTPLALPVAADMHATFESVLALIDKAESMSRLVRVSSVRLMCKREDAASGTRNGQAGARGGTGGADVDVGESPLIQASIGLEVIYDSSVDGVGP